jgi:hypothetical protein
MAKFKDLQGLKFGNLLVLNLNRKIIYPNSKKSSFIWNCLCDCGNLYVVSGSALKNGKSTHCGCKKLFVTMIGEKYGRLTVLKRVEDYVSETGYDISFSCQCDCGNIIIVRMHSLRSGDTKSCGCLRNEIFKENSNGGSKPIDIVGQRFGNLTVLKLSNERSGDGNIKWECLCDCGNIVNVQTTSLKSGNTVSCGCLKESSIANRLKRYFQKKYKADIEYKIVKNPETNRFLPYDIFIKRRNVFIEVHGEQHYEFSKFFHRTIENFEHSKKMDKIKKDYASEHGIYIEIDLRERKSFDYLVKFIKEKINGSNT